MIKVLSLCLLALSLLLSSCSNPVAGGSSDHGNAFAGVALTSDGDPAANMVIHLLPDNYNHLKDSGKVYKKVMTDSTGNFSFDSIYDGTYCISGKDRWSGESFLLKNIILEACDSLSDSIYTAKEGSIYIDRADSLGLREGTIVFLPGLPIYAMVDSTCVVSLRNIPPGKVNLSGYDPSADEIIWIDRRFSEVDIISTKTMLLPSRSPTPFYVGPDFSFQRTVEGYVDSSYRFSAVEPSKPLDNNYSYRFSWGDGSISEWKEIASTTYSWRRPGTYLVQSQTMRIGIYNAWSDYITVIIRE
ncbi:MAG: hypothetical protein ACOC41_02980 [Chitinivibrionales bacterium]